MNESLIKELLDKNIRVVAVTKKHTKEEVDQLYALGLSTFGENRVQEFLTKYDPKYHWHIIGHLQTNKVKYVVGKVDMIESVDSLKLAKEINKQASKKSIFGSLFKSNTILYGKKYGLAVATKDSKEISVGSLHEFKYEYPYPIEYLVDPVEYIEKMNSLKKLGRGK